MEKFTEFMTEVRKIRGLKTVVFEYDDFMNDLIVKFTPRQFNTIVNEIFVFTYNNVLMLEDSRKITIEELIKIIKEFYQE